MGYFVSYRHTGADPDRLEQLLPAVRDTFNECGVDSYCTYFDEAEFQNKGLDPSQIMEHAFRKIEELGGLFVVIDGADKSEGQLLEVGFCLAKSISIVVAKRSIVTNTYIDKMTNSSFTYDDIEGLKKSIKQICEVE